MNRRTGIKAIIAAISAVVFYVFVHRWVIIYAKPNLSLLREKKILTAELAEMIIPRTDTPGARDAKVDDFILDYIESCADLKVQNNFIRGLSQVESKAIAGYDKNFILCTHEDKLAILKELETKANFQFNIVNKISSKILGKPFILKFKELTVEGYCNSYLGVTRGLAYDHNPGIYASCILLSTDQKSWATK